MPANIIVLYFGSGDGIGLAASRDDNKDTKKNLDDGGREAMWKEGERAKRLELFPTQRG